VTNDGTEDLEISSNRGTYSVNVSADGLDQGDLEEIFGNVSAYNDYGEDEDTIVLEDVSDGTFQADFNDIDTGQYTFDFEVTDTSASASDTVNVSEADEGDIQFAEDTPQEEVGDVADITLEMDNTDEGTVTIGSADQNYWIVAEVEDGDDDGEVTLEFNSYTAGSWDNGSNSVLAASDSDDSVDTITEGGSFDPANPEDDLLDATEYDMNVSVGHNSLSSDAYGEADEVGALSLRDRSTDNMTIWTAPDDFSDWDDADTINAGVGSNVTQTDEVASGDYAIVQIEASGLEGHFNRPMKVNSSAVTQRRWWLRRPTPVRTLTQKPSRSTLMTSKSSLTQKTTRTTLPWSRTLATSRRLSTPPSSPSTTNSITVTTTS